MDRDDSLRRYGLHPAPADLDAIRVLLVEQIEREYDDEGDRDLMRLCCSQLFHAGELRDVLLIWEAKGSSFDAHCTIDAQLLCGAGLAETKAYLAAEGSDAAADALEWLTGCDEAGDFTRFTVERYARSEASHYLPG
ncbi:hypothetical protein [Micromonospora sp. CPCC 205556]|uniref:hypothetical protein n=1 Tax=Micromonospora sp. CPCC 205556 TaxID=3122398 RepID=UPI002FEFE94B